MNLPPTEARLLDLLSTLPQPVAAGRLAALAWPRVGEEQALNSLKVYVLKLRRRGFVINCNRVPGSRQFEGYRLLGLAAREEAA